MDFCSVCFAQRSCWAFSVAKKEQRIASGHSRNCITNLRTHFKRNAWCHITLHHQPCQTWPSLIPARSGSAEQTNWSMALPIRLIPSRQLHVLGDLYWADVVEKKDAFTIFERRFVQIRNNIPYRWTPGTYDHRAWQTTFPVCSAVLRT